MTQKQYKLVEELPNEVKEELLSAINQHNPMNSCHEGYAVILEEVDELWDEIKKRYPSKRRIRAEAIQVAAMALRLIVDCIAFEEAE